MFYTSDYKTAWLDKAIGHVIMFQLFIGELYIIDQMITTQYSNGVTQNSS